MPKYKKKDHLCLSYIIPLASYIWKLMQNTYLIFNTKAL